MTPRKTTRQSTKAAAAAHIDILAVKKTSTKKKTTHRKIDGIVVELLTCNKCGYTSTARSCDSVECNPSKTTSDFIRIDHCKSSHPNNIYIISQNKRTTPDAYSSAVVAAWTTSRARRTHPDGREASLDTRTLRDPHPTWCEHIDDVECKLIGFTPPNTKVGVIAFAKYG